jgi:hypothetical protein
MNRQELKWSILLVAGVVLLLASAFVIFGIHGVAVFYLIPAGTYAQSPSAPSIIPGHPDGESGFPAMVPNVSEDIGKISGISPASILGEKTGDGLNITIPTQTGALRAVAEEPVPKLANEGGTQFSSLKQTLEYVSYSSNLPVSRWDLNPTNNEVTLFVYDIHNETMMTEYQGKRIGNYTFNFIHDTAFEKNRKETIDYFTQLREDPAYEIAQIVTMTDAFGGISGKPANYVELWVYNSTPENKKLKWTVINGWLIEVYPLTKSIQWQEQMEKMAAANRSIPEVLKNAN